MERYYGQFFGITTVTGYVAVFIFIKVLGGTFMFRNKRAFAVMALLMCVMTVFSSFSVFADEPLFISEQQDVVAVEDIAAENVVEHLHR